jgi:hypothetical protein
VPEYGPRSTGGGALFLIGGLYSLDAIGGLNSSPWTAESFGGDPVKAASCKRFVMKAIVVSTAFAAYGGWLDRSWWPIVGVAAMNTYLYYEYRKALDRAAASGSVGWGNG